MGILVAAGAALGEAAIQAAVEAAVEQVTNKFTETYSRVIELRNQTDKELRNVPEYPTSFESWGKSHFSDPPDGTIPGQEIEVFGVEGKYCLVTGYGINGWCTYTCDSFDLMICYAVTCVVGDSGLNRVGVWLTPPGTITQSLGYTDYRVEYDKDTIECTYALPDGKRVVHLRGAAGDTFEFTLDIQEN